jgi:hypothetical protein
MTTRNGVTTLQDARVLGNNYAYWKPGLDFQTVVSVGSTLKHGITKLNPYLACKWFVAGYAEISVIPGINEKLRDFNERKFHIMGKLQEAINANSTLPGFVKASTLADLGAVFCIVDIRERVDNFKGRETPQWALDIMLDDELAQGIELKDSEGNPSNMATLTLGRTSSRDRMFSSLATNLPVHCAMLVSVPMQRGGSFYDMREYGGTCPCGYSEPELHTTASETPAVDPFLPEWDDVQENNAKAARRNNTKK